MSSPIALELFDLLLHYSDDIEQGRIQPARRLASTSPALTFCENFYAQFFQNVIGQEITGFNSEAKKGAVRLRVQIKAKKGPQVIIQLITWFEELCEIYSNVLALGYGGGTSAAALGFHRDYLVVLLERISVWAQSERYTELEQRASMTLTQFKNALRSLEK